MSLIHILIAAVIGCALTGIGGYLAGRDAGADDMKAQWDAEKIASYVLVEKARAEIGRVERKAELEVRRISESYTEEIRRRDVAAAATRRELDRLRQSIAAAGNSQPAPVTPDRPPADGAAPAAGNLLGECATELVEMGGHAERLSGQVMSLQDYVRTLQRMQ